MEQLLVKQPVMAEMLGVSVRWLRNSECPTISLPANKVGGRPLVRYDPIQVREWYRNFPSERRVA